jgi:hypothetical protein
MIEDNSLRLIDVKTGEKLLTFAESQDTAQREVNARKKAEAEVEKLRAELAKLRGEK